MSEQNKLPVERCMRISYGDKAYESGANPDFRPGRMTAQEADMRRLMARVSAQSDSLDRRIKAMKALEQRRKDMEPTPDRPAAVQETAEPVAESQSEEAIE